VTTLNGWAPDPYGKHEGRYFGDGQPTNRVRDGNRFFYDDLGVDTRAVPTLTVEPPVALGPAAAWYPDPTDPDLLRYWDGQRWTGDVAAVSALAAPGAPAASASPAAPGAPPAPAVPPAAAAPPAAKSSPSAPEPVTKEQPMPPTTTPAGATQAAPGAQVPAEPPPPAASDHVRQSPPAPGAAPPAPAGRPERSAVEVPKVADPGRQAGVKIHTAHYVVAPEHDGRRESSDAGEPVTIITGEVPSGYNRITLECEHGVVVEATVLDPPPIGSGTYFAALAPTRVLRIVATTAGGAYGIFVDVDRLGERDTTAKS
jgi:hypothetical protein